ncbi:hypothetical protein Tco_0796719 [Tanacetum coccineum]
MIINGCWCMSMVYVLTTPIPKDGENATVEQIRKRAKWDNDDYVCRGLILKGLSQGFWGEAMAVVRLPDAKLKTLGEKGIECIYLGYVEHSKAFRVYVNEPNDSVSINSIIESSDVIFDENRFLTVPKPSQMSLVTGTKDIEAINDEMDSIVGNNTWVLADLPLGCKPLGCKWIFKRKLKIDGTIENSKARLVIRALDRTFLNGELDKEVYMNQPQGFIMPGNKNKWFCHESGKGVIIFLYVDDMLIFGTDQVQVDLTKEFFSSRFPMKDIGEADVIFVSTPMDTSEKLMPNNGQAVSQLEYSRVIGCLMYAMTCTRSDIEFIMGKLSRYTSNPGTQHWQAIQRVLKYLKKIIDYRLTYTGYPSMLEGYTDTSWISNTEDNSSASGWVFLLAAGKEVEWLKNLLLEILLWSKPIAPISIRCDSTATLTKAYSQMYSGKSRHFSVRHSMIRELITNGVISIKFVRSQQNLANHLTKGLSRDLVINSVEWMGLKFFHNTILVQRTILDHNFMGVSRRQTQLRRSARVPNAFHFTHFQETPNLYGDLILNTATDIADDTVGMPGDATTTTVEGNVRLESVFSFRAADDVFEATTEISYKQAQITDATPLLDIQTQRYEELEQEKIRNRFPLSALLKVGPQNYQLMYSQEYYPTQDYSTGHGSAQHSAHVDNEEDDSPVKEMSPVKAKKPLKRASKAKKGNSMKAKGFWEAVIKYFENETEVEMPSFYKNTNGQKKSKIYETTSGSASGLNNEADESEEETQEQRPMGRDRAKAKKKSSTSSREGSSSFVDLVADKFLNIKKEKWGKMREQQESYIQLKNRELDIREAERREAAELKIEKLAI